jgi:hypothetical protein
MSKSSQKAIFEHWFGIDNILFGKKASEAIENTELYEKYLVNKGAFLSNLYEIYEKLNYVPEKEYKTVVEMCDVAKKNSDKALKDAKSICESEEVKKVIREEIDEVATLSESADKIDVARSVVRKRRDAVAIDSMVMEDALTDENSKMLSDWTGDVLVNAHKTLRDFLIDIAVSI